MSDCTDCKQPVDRNDQHPIYKPASCRNCKHTDSEFDGLVSCEAPIPANVHTIDGMRFDPKIEWAFLVPVKDAEATAAICKCYQRDE